jgi:hypothetical protein
MIPSTTSATRYEIPATMINVWTMKTFSHTQGGGGSVPNGTHTPGRQALTARLRSPGGEVAPGGHSSYHYEKR